MKTLNHSKAMPNPIVINTVLESEQYIDDGINAYNSFMCHTAEQLCDIEKNCIREVDEFLARMVSQ